MLRRIDLCVEQPGKQFRIFVQGPFDFIERIREALSKGTDGRICVACTDQVKSSQWSHWNKISLGHAEVGGVISAKWKYGRLVDLTNLPELLSTTPVQASVLDYIKHTEQGTPASKENTFFLNEYRSNSRRQRLFAVIDSAFYHCKIV